MLIIIPSSHCRLLIDIQIGFLDSDVITEISSYETSSWVRCLLAKYKIYALSNLASLFFSYLDW